jgi:ABC-type iron transport system FetAB permease component
MAPLLFVIAASWKMELGLGSAIVTGAFRTLVQLSILGVVLQPIFAASNIYVVLGYSFLMTICVQHMLLAQERSMYSRVNSLEF